MKKLSQRLAEKSMSACLSALEIYNKPETNYREESFCILMINAFELIFKAKILFENNENRSSLYVYENKKNKKGIISKKKTIKRNRLSEPLTIDINKCMNKLLTTGLITNNIKENVDIIVEIRDNAIHLINSENNIKEKVHSVCAGSIKNFVRIIQEWFPSIDMSYYNFFITPLNFDTGLKSYDSIDLNTAQRNFINYIDLVSNTASKEDDYDILLNIDVKLTKNDVDESVLIKYAEDGKKINVELNEETFKKMYPFTYEQIMKKVKEKRPEIKTGSRLFVNIRKELQKDEICCKLRYLDIVNKKGQTKMFYNSNFVNKILEAYDKNLKYDDNK